VAQAREASVLDAVTDRRTSVVRPKKAAEQAELERLRNKVARLEKDLARRDAALDQLHWTQRRRCPQPPDLRIQRMKGAQLASRTGSWEVGQVSRS